jgi:hypothetical protein
MLTSKKRASNFDKVYLQKEKKLAQAWNGFYHRFVLHVVEDLKLIFRLYLLVLYLSLYSTLRFRKLR